MRLFISYARMDRSHCVQIAEVLDAHEIWYDQRLYIGQQWWKEILRRLEWCEGFIYLLSPDSVNSEYCRREFTIARESGRHIFPVLIDAQTVVPPELEHIQYADLSDSGKLDTEAVKCLLNAIHQVELEDLRNPQAQPKQSIVDKLPDMDFTMTDVTTLLSRVAEAMEQEKYDDAVVSLEQAVAQNLQSRFINIKDLLGVAKSALDKQIQDREAERAYSPIVELVTRKATRSIGCQSFKEFRQVYPEYDPKKLSQLCDECNTPFELPLLEWCLVQQGKLLVNTERVHKNGNGNIHPQVTEVSQFYISKYPITNAQYQVFCDDPDGYAQTRWWQFSPDALAWHSQHPTPLPPKFKGDDLPRENVTWYEAMAFCEWLSDKIGQRITLPTHDQWQRAARGNNDWLYPWGNHFDITLANTSEAKLRRTAPVTAYDNAISPFGLMGMAGNIWEWCLNSGGPDAKNRVGEGFRAICGGSYMSDQKRAQTNFHFNLNPEYCYSSIGFRVVSLDAPK